MLIAYLEINEEGCAPMKELATKETLVWHVYSLKDYFMGFEAKQKVLIRKDTETPEAKRGISSYWVLSPKQKRVVRWSEEIFKESVYKNSVQTVSDIKYDRVFWSLIDPMLKTNQTMRREFAYVFFRYKGSPVKVSDQLNSIVLKPGLVYTFYKYGKTLWSLRAMNKLGKLVEVDGLSVQQILKLERNSEELAPIPQPTKFDLLKADPTRDIRTFNYLGDLQ